MAAPKEINIIEEEVIDNTPFTAGTSQGNGTNGGIDEEKDESSPFKGGIPQGKEEVVEEEIIEDEVPKVATEDEAVVDRGEVEEEPIELEFTRDTFTDIQGKQNAGQTLTEEEKLFLGKIKAKKDAGQTVESIFGEDIETPESLLSDQQAQDIGDRLASGKDSALEGLGLAAVQFLNNDRVAEVLKDQGFTDNQINQIINRRDANLAGKEREKITEERITEQSELLRKEQERADEKIREQTLALQNQTQRLRSLRGVGRGTATEAEILKLEKDGQELISANEKVANLQLQRIRLEEEGAELEALSSIDTAIADAEVALQEKLNANLVSQKIINDQIDVDFDTAIKGMLGLLETSGIPTEDIDQEASKKLGYFVKTDGSIFKNKAGNFVEFKTTGATSFTPSEIDEFATSLALGKVKFSDLDLEGGDLAKVITAMNIKLDKEPGLSTNRLKAERILKDLGLGTDDNSVNTVTNLLKIKNEKEVRDMIATDEFKNAAFVGGNQKLFDDLRKDAQSFKDIDRSFKGMNDIFDEFSKNPEGNRAAMEQALIIMFNKMLDPGSVVREGEFDRTSQGQSVIATATGFVDRLAKGGAGITTETLKEMVGIAGILHEASLDTVSDLKDSYKSFAGDLGADPEFVNRFFEQGFEGPEFELDEDEQTELQNIFGETPTDTTSTGNQFETSSGKTFDINFNGADQTAGNKGIPESGFTEQVDIVRTGTNIAKDTNNPGNITSDSIPAGKTKKEYGEIIGATGTYLSPNGREYFIFPTVDAGTGALQRDITAKITGGSRNIKPEDTLARFQRVYVGETSPDYLAVLKRITGASDNTQIKDIDPKLLTQAVMKAEGFTNS